MNGVAEDNIWIQTRRRNSRMRVHQILLILLNKKLDGRTLSRHEEDANANNIPQENMKGINLLGD